MGELANTSTAIALHSKKAAIRTVMATRDCTFVMLCGKMSFAIGG
jgi:hypothetical protein